MTGMSPPRPHKEAARITKMLDMVLGADRFDRAPVDVAALALEYSANVTPGGPIHRVEEADITGCVGALVCSPQAPRQWAIMYNRGAVGRAARLHDRARVRAFCASPRPHRERSGLRAGDLLR